MTVRADSLPTLEEHVTVEGPPGELGTRPLRFKLRNGVSLKVPVAVAERAVELARTDPGRRVPEGTLVPVSWLTGARVGY